MTERSNVGYAEQNLKDALSNQMLELEEKCKMAEQTRAYFGEEMYQKLMEIDETRNDAMVFEEGICSKGNLNL